MQACEAGCGWSEELEAQRGRRGQGKGRCRRVSYADHATAEQDWESYVRRGTLAKLFSQNDGPTVHKWHHYIPLYDTYFSRYRNTNVRFLEIGVAEGGSLQMWRKYFGPSATIFGIDIDEGCARLNGHSAQVRIGSQA